MATKHTAKNILYTIGHSTRTIEDFIGLLNAYEVKKIVDVRTIPRSRHNPQFDQTTLSESLQNAGIEYVQLNELGGLRHSTLESKNLGWHNKSFRSYADYMSTPSFKEGIESLKKIAAEETTAIMCAEAVPWRCHRSLIGDAMTKQKYKVYDIMTVKKASIHHLTSFLKMRKGEITYPETKA